MKRNIFDRPAMDEVLARVQKLEGHSVGLWGKLTPEKMVRHLSEAARMAIDEVVVKDCSNVFTRTLVKWLFLNNVKPPGREKGKIKTFPEVNVVDLKLQVEDLNAERARYLATLNRVINTKELSKRHPLFGKMSRADWGFLTYAHADYHLTQFNV